ncbi:hypothetical protein PpBr36_04549 [Pyricularia pennisetigena]|uniref:hypothetical protein n=1 Tax=Pyricularia pennisetigena TaxID=1578925 RepID=UPI00114E520C|nr:hypothetical protein PpBr36_04549 [Pyricularia pennisetigena]TLS26285.1 hypothetical protein PpBr36_04549 [Pyricularia pennisetigena]
MLRLNLKQLGSLPCRHLRFSVPRSESRLLVPCGSRPHPIQTLKLNFQRQTHHEARHPGTSRTLTSHDDTIYALSSAQGRAGIAVIRISGPDCLEIYRRLCPGKKPLKPRYATVRTLYAPEDGPGSPDVLDSGALVLYFPGPKTVTGEDVLELHTHGGRATVKSVLSAIPRCVPTAAARVRYADPGEFTRRAFFNDRLDLAQVESLGDALDAETEQQRRAAVRGCSGRLGASYDDWRERLLFARAEIEALIDFSEDQHFEESPHELLHSVVGQVRDILALIALHEMASKRSELLRKGIRIALLGPPNVGKSSLMNLIVGREASIVSTEAGTTRDIVEASLDIRGYLCTFADTAGFRSEGMADASAPAEIGIVEKEGIRRARSKALGSDIVVVLASVEKESKGEYSICYEQETVQLAAQAPQSLVVINKSEQVPASALKTLVTDFKGRVLAPVPGLQGAEPLLISCKEGGNADAVGLKNNVADPGSIHALVDSLSARFESLTSLPDDMQDLLGVTERQGQLLARCRGHLDDFISEATRSSEKPGSQIYQHEEDIDVVLAAEHLRYAANALAEITGRGDYGDTEEVLGVIFEKFCVGK